jgi:putative tryptophan/tyrosine transport system substrate-binding protein
VPSTLAAKAATITIPIVFNVGTDPVRVGLVASLNRPGGNLTGFNQFNGELVAKGLALLHELVPKARAIGFLENPDNPIIDELTTSDALAAAPALGIQIQILKAATDQEIDAAFGSLVQSGSGAVGATQPHVRYERISGRRAEALDCLVYGWAARSAIPIELRSA